MTRAEYALALMAEATAHGIRIIYGNREIGLSTHRTVDSWDPSSGELQLALHEELQDYANEVWAILHHHRKAIS